MRIDNIVEALKGVDTISFSSTITKEEIANLLKIANSIGAKLYCKDCYGYNNFVEAYNSVSLSGVCETTLEDIANSDFVIAFGSRFLDNYKEVCNYIKDDSSLIYMHPIEDDRLERVSQFIKYEPGSEEGIVALLLELLTRDESLPNTLKEYIDELDIGYLSGESSVSEEELDEILERIVSKDKTVLVVGSDVFNHPEVENIAKILGAIERFGNVKIFIAPPTAKAKALKGICSLVGEPKGNTTELKDGKIEGFTLSEVAKALDIESKKFQSVANDDTKTFNLALSDVEELPSFDGVVIYCVDNPQENRLVGTKPFSMAAKISDGDNVEFKIGSSSYKRVFSIDTSLKGTIALNPTLDMGLSGFTVSSYRFCKIFINKVGSANE